MELHETKSTKKLPITEQKVILALRNLLKESRTVSEDTTLQDMLKFVKGDETAHHSQFRWEGIDDAFKLKVAGNPFEDAITSAFFQTHTYKYIDNPTFKKSFQKELTQRAIPTIEVDGAMKHFDSLVKELSKNPGEQDSGWNPNMKDIVDVTTNADSRTAKHTDPFTGGGLRPDGDAYDKGTIEGFDV